LARDKNEAINSYITDMLALEDHIEKAVKAQLTDLKDYPDVLAELRQFHHKIEHHLSDLRTLSDRRGAGGVVESVKRAGAAVAGAAAGLIDLLRTEGLPKNLRDDYTAFNLASIGYAMLHTTALALDDQEVAELSLQHYRDYTETVLQLNKLVPASVVRYLELEGLPAREEAVQLASQHVQDAWKQTSGRSPSPEPASARRL